MAEVPDEFKRNSIAMADFIKDYEAAFDLLKERLVKTMISENVLNQNGITMVLNHVELLRDTINPVGQKNRDRYVKDTKMMVVETMYSLGVKLISQHRHVCVNGQSDEITLFVPRLLRTVTSFNDTWLGRYQHLTGSGRITIVIKIKNFCLSLFNIHH